MLRFFSLLLRRLQFQKDSRKLLSNFGQWNEEIRQKLPPYSSSGKKLLIIRLDDIGDYLLFRNTLPFYKKGKWKNYEVTLLGNSAWKVLFELLDSAEADKTIWLNKRQFYQSHLYRFEVWTQLREAGFEAVICPSRTRPLLLDDTCILATGASVKIASANTFLSNKWNDLSDHLYNQLYKVDNKIMHEFIFNVRLANWANGTSIQIKRPEIILNAQRNILKPYLLCFIGASVKSKRWTESQWIELIKLYRKCFTHTVVVAGGEADLDSATRICAATAAQSITGTTSLYDIVTCVCNATALVTNDTMTVHLAASCNVPAVVVANGNKYYRFTEYERLGIENITTVYPKAFTRKLNKTRDNLSEHYMPVTADIATIPAREVFDQLAKVIGERSL